MLDVHAEDHGLLQGIKFLKQTSQMPDYGFAAIGQGYFPLELGSEINLLGFNPIGNENFSPFFNCFSEMKARGIDGRAHPVNTISCQKSIIDALAKAVLVGRRSPGSLIRIIWVDGYFGFFGAEIEIRIDVIVLLGSGRHPQMDGIMKMVQNFPPGPKAGAMALVDNNQIEEILREFFE